MRKAFPSLQIGSPDFPPWISHGEHYFEGSQDQEYTSAGYACIGYGYTGDMDAARVWINGKFSVFHTDDMGSIPVIRKVAYLVKLVNTTDLKSVPSRLSVQVR